MKTPVTRLALALAAASALHAASAPPPDPTPTRPIIAHSATQSEPLEPLLARGATRADVVAAIGEPPEKLSADVWVYWNYRTTEPEADRRGYDTLLLTFKGQRLTAMRIAERRAVEMLLVRVRLNSGIRYGG